MTHDCRLLMHLACRHSWRSANKSLTRFCLALLLALALKRTSSQRWYIPKTQRWDPYVKPDKWSQLWSLVPVLPESKISHPAKSRRLYDLACPQKDDLCTISIRQNGRSECESTIEQSFLYAESWCRKIRCSADLPLDALLLGWGQGVSTRVP